ncbi:CLUMA_CG013889, isoform A [Clunio marinus]|uniref:CLUMA_CG013889, isoform A n=1 Tax=Clunio marinus TaxID=568069 RepID=A0A1J1IK59_9DIPT|nr:CLUMA_CG013889, isoform A [Clunio marinus]
MDLFVAKTRKKKNEIPGDEENKKCFRFSPQTALKCCKEQLSRLSSYYLAFSLLWVQGHK